MGKKDEKRLKELDDKLWELARKLACQCMPYDMSEEWVYTKEEHDRLREKIEREKKKLDT